MMVLSLPFLLPSLGHATTIDPVAASTTLARAGLVVDGTLIDRREEMHESGLPLVYFQLAVEDTLKGSAEDIIEFKLPGGWIENHTYVQVAGRPEIQVGDRILVAVDQSQSVMDAPGTGVMTTFSLYLAIQDASWGGAPLALSGQRDFISDYSTSQPLTTPFEEVGIDMLLTECSPEDELQEVDIMTWDSLKTRWSATIENQMWEPYFVEGEHFTGVTQ